MQQKSKFIRGTSNPSCWLGWVLFLQHSMQIFGTGSKHRDLWSRMPLNKLNSYAWLWTWAPISRHIWFFCRSTLLYSLFHRTFNLVLFEFSFLVILRKTGNPHIGGTLCVWRADINSDSKYPICISIKTEKEKKTSTNLVPLLLPTFFSSPAALADLSQHHWN